MIYLFVGVGGVIGAILRYSVGLALTGQETVFPIATLLTNLAGCFVLGWFTTYLSKRIHPFLVTGLGTGLIGSFTTFSTFSVETVTLLKAAYVGPAFLYVFLSLFGGLLLSYFGYKCGEQI
ncbi:camphor resistance protein CrcB [Scopulibacillus darangshiensis]|uniref:Fluoride-specific ion channel FluC n=1 Tax=Scopulibacillus darangshiensis TaxID=442528 RepID=A0A4R2PC75_9BACL|nr:fluoride efflux transporter CrcB [Scopulibacillus darangshiensis]TCP31525.1 camphor resistance protein CrcB [Scopulibacillus darangshiensis]